MSLLEDESEMLKCEKVVNESWSIVRAHQEELEVIIERGQAINKREKSILIIAAGVALQQLTLDNAKDDYYFSDHNKVPCGRKYKSCEECDLEECDLSDR